MRSRNIKEKTENTFFFSVMKRSKNHTQCVDYEKTVQKE
jgi:hypothetical protein